MTLRSFSEGDSGAIQVDEGCPDTIEDGGFNTDSSDVPRHGPRIFPILELLLILYAIFQSGLLSFVYWWIHGTLFANLPEGGWQWVYLFIYEAGPLGILGYILYCNLRAPNTERPDSELRSVRISGLLLVLYVAFALSVLSSVGYFIRGTTAPARSHGATWIYEVYTMLNQAGPLVLLGYMLHRNSRSFRELGLEWRTGDAATALPLVVAGHLAYDILRPIGLWGAQVIAGHPVQTPDVGGMLFGSSVSMAAIGSVILNGFFEELLVRGYLMTEIKWLTNSRLLAVVGSVGLQTSYHFYQGTPLALSHIGFFLLLALYYSKTNRVLPPILAHILVDLVSLTRYAGFTASAG
jgi:membrane protease YdiL (CAAX protease family)